MAQPQTVAWESGLNPAENYQRYFVPAIGAPAAEDLVARAKLKQGERVLDVACGTGVVARMAADRVGPTGSVSGLDIHPGMLEVAKSATPPGTAIEWREADARSMPIPDNSFDVALCAIGLQFVSEKLAALREMRRVLVAGGRALIAVPGPKPPLFAIMIDALASHVGPQAAAFGERVFSLHDTDELGELMRGAGFRDVEVASEQRALRLPAPGDFLWQYLYSTPLAEAVHQIGKARRDALEREVCGKWQRFVENGSLALNVGVTTAAGVK